MGVIQGTANPESISGAAKSSDDLVGLAGSDRYYFSGNWGNDRIIDSAGDEDTIYFEHDVPRYYTNIARAYNEDGSPSDDLVITYTNDALFASVTVVGQFAAGQNGVIENIQYYGYKNLVIFGNIIRDGTVVGDPINGFLGDDRINGKAGDDSIYGSAGIDSLNGDTGNDYLDGGADNDVLSGGIGNDSLYGSSGKDTFTFNLGDGTDRIEDGNSEDLVILEGIADASNVRLVYNPGYQESYYDDDGNEIFYEYGQGYKVFYGNNDSIEISGDLPVVRLSDGWQRFGRHRSCWHVGQRRHPWPRWGRPD
jgi:Ca2+-binding RTX toxin-like protein